MAGGKLQRMKRVSLILFLMLVSFANLVFAADWHERAAGDELALEAIVDGGDATEHSDHPHPPGGNCMHSHSCHAHAHLFSIDTDGYRVTATEGDRWQAVNLPLPPQHFMAPDVPPPIA